MFKFATTTKSIKMNLKEIIKQKITGTFNFDRKNG